MATRKAALIIQTRRELASRLEHLARAAREAREAATDPDSRAESKYDTRRLEASYLAAGQARQAAEMAEVLRVFEQLDLDDEGASGVVGAGSLVVVEMVDGPVSFLLVPAGGGIELVGDGGAVTLLSPESPLYQRLWGMQAGDELGQPALRVLDVS